MKTWFDCGWDDTVHGITSCTTVQQFLEYIHITRKTAALVRTEYTDGCVAAINRCCAYGIIPEMRAGSGNRFFC